MSEEDNLVNEGEDDFTISPSSSESGHAKPKTKKSQANGTTGEKTEQLLVDSTLFGAIAGAALLDECLPTIGLLLGQTITDSRTLLVSQMMTLHRCMAHLMKDRLIIPHKDHFHQTLQRIRSEQVAVLGFYICDPIGDETGRSGVGVETILSMLRTDADCAQPVMLQLKRILKGSTASSIDAGIQVEFYRIDGFDSPLIPLQFRILDRSYVSPQTLVEVTTQRSLIASEFVKQKSLPEMSYDVFLSQEIIKKTPTAKLTHGLVESTRIAQRKMHLRWMLKERIDAIQQMWRNKHADLADSGAIGDRFSQHMSQLIAKELPIALADVQRRLPPHHNIPYHERPLAALKAPRTLVKTENNGITSPALAAASSSSTSLPSSQPALKKAKVLKPTTQINSTKGPLRPLLPLNSTMSSSGTAMGRPLSPIPAAEHSDPIDSASAALEDKEEFPKLIKSSPS